MEELQDLAAREQELADQREKVFVTEAMRVFPKETVYVLGRKLRSLNITPESIAAELQRRQDDASYADGQVKSRRKLAQEKRLDELKKHTHAAAKAQMADPGWCNWIPEKYECLGDFSVEMLIAHVLEKVEPGALWREHQGRAEEAS